MNRWMDGNGITAFKGLIFYRFCQHFSSLIAIGVEELVLMFCK